MDAAREMVRELVEQGAATYASLSRLIEKNPSYMQQFVERGSPRQLHERDRLTLARHFDLSPSELGAAFAPLADMWAKIAPLQPEQAPSATLRREMVRSRGLREEDLRAFVADDDDLAPHLARGDVAIIELCSAPVRTGLYLVRSGGIFDVWSPREKAAGFATLPDHLQLLGRIRWILNQL